LDYLKEDYKKSKKHLPTAKSNLYSKKGWKMLLSDKNGDNEFRKICLEYFKEGG